VEFAAALVSQCEAEKNTVPLLTLYCQEWGNRGYWRKKSKTDDTPIWIDITSGPQRTAIDNNSYFQNTSYRTFDIQTGYYCYNDKVTLEEKYSITKGICSFYFTPDGEVYYASVPYLRVTPEKDENDNIRVTWQDGRETLFYKKSERLWTATGNFNGPDLIEYKDLRIEYNSGYYYIKGEYRDIQHSVDSWVSGLKAVNARWYFANMPTDGSEWTSAGGKVVEIKDDGTDGRTLAELDLFCKPPKVPTGIVWKCKNIQVWVIHPDNDSVVSDCIFDKDGFAEAYLVYNCVYNEGSAMNGRIFDRCKAYNCRVENYETLSPNVMSRCEIYNEKIGVTFFDWNLISHSTFVGTDLQSINSSSKINFEYSTFTLTAQESRVIYVNNLTQCTFNFTLAKDVWENGTNPSLLDMGVNAFAKNLTVNVYNLKGTFEADWQRPYQRKSFTVLECYIPSGNVSPVLNNVEINKPGATMSFKNPDNEEIGCYEGIFCDISAWDRNTLDIKCIAGCQVKRWGSKCEDSDTEICGDMP
jgi:hypothetical protein